jgi:glycosyltransferase involved in cell wall biosynthesis
MNGNPLAGSQRGFCVGIVVHGIVEDWLDPLGASLEDFVHRFHGSWLFNYACGLQGEGIRCVIFVLARIAKPRKEIHASGAIIHLLPAPLFQRVRPRRRPVSIQVRGSVGEPTLGWRWVRRLKHTVADTFGLPARGLREAVRQERCDALVVQEYETVSFDRCVGVGESLGIPVFGTFTGGRAPSASHRTNHHRAIRRSAGLIVCATPELERVRRTYSLPAERLLHLAYPLDFRVWYPEDRLTSRAALGIPTNATVLLYVGAIAAHVKGLDVLLDAWQHVRRPSDARPHLLQIVGDGIDADWLSLEIRRRRLTDLQFVRGWVHDRVRLRQRLSAADVFVFPSRGDAFGIAVIEAMACGLPVIMGASPGARDILPAGESSGGLIVPRGDPLALREAMQRLSGDAGLRQQMGKAARERVAAPAFGADASRRLAMFLRSGGGHTA